VSELRVSVIVPTLNEAASIGQVLSEMPADTLVFEVIVVDGGSTDGTREIAEAAGARVLLETRRGYGRACATGVAAARGEIVLFCDGDGADDPGQIPELLTPLLSGEAEMVLGSRLAGLIASGAMPAHQRFGNWLSAALIRLLYGLRLTDLSPFRAARRGPLLALDMQEMTYGWPTEMLVKAARRGWRVVELPVRYRPRIGGQSKISGTFKGTVLATYYILWTIVRYAFSRNGDKEQAK